MAQQFKRGQIYHLIHKHGQETLLRYTSCTNHIKGVFPDETFFSFYILASTQCWTSGRRRYPQLSFLESDLKDYKIRCSIKPSELPLFMYMPYKYKLFKKMLEEAV